jgi:hypothetical protein
VQFVAPLDDDDQILQARRIEKQVLRGAARGDSEPGLRLAFDKSPQRAAGEDGVADRSGSNKQHPIATKTHRRGPCAKRPLALPTACDASEQTLTRSRFGANTARAARRRRGTRPGSIWRAPIRGSTSAGDFFRTTTWTVATTSPTSTSAGPGFDRGDCRRFADRRPAFINKESVPTFDAGRQFQRTIRFSRRRDEVVERARRNEVDQRRAVRCDSIDPSAAERSADKIAPQRA